MSVAPNVEAARRTGHMGAMAKGLGSGSAGLRLSVVICCHNSAARLEPTLNHLAAQTGLTPSQWEVVLVDNGSTDGTAARALDLWRAAGSPVELRVVPEPKLGLINARLAGIAQARHEILTFVDDDNWVCPDWCATALGLMAAHPEVGVLGSRGEPAFEPGQEIPAWFAPLRHGYATGPQARHSGFIDGPTARFYGAGLTLRRAALNELLQSGFTPLCTGRSGARLTAGEDSELCYALALRGWRLWYEDRLRFSHFIPAGRLTDQYAEKLFHGLGVTSAIEEFYFETARARRPAGLADRLRGIESLRVANALRHWLRRRLAVLLAAPGTPKRVLAEIEARFFEGRLEGMRDCRRNRRAIVAHIAGWAPQATAANPPA
jgi:glycosyltransferase involved in cell wall biosynthesis